MKTQKNKILATTIALILIVSTAASLTLIQSTSAHTPAWNIPTYAFINVAPNPAGLGQQVTLGFWLNIPPPTAAGVYGDRFGNMTVKVTHPDGTTETLGPFTSDATGGSYTLFTPNQLGNYTFQMTFGGQTLAGNNLYPGTTNVFIGDYYMPSTSPIATLAVQQEPIPVPAQNPLPSEYWTRPVQSVNSQWSNLVGNWLGLGTIVTFTQTGLYNVNGNYNPYTDAPQSAHILWTKPEAFGGLLGGEFGAGDTSVYMSDSIYEPKFAPVIINGILYYTQYTGSKQNPAGVTAVDLRTGQTVWTNNIPIGNDPNNNPNILKCGQVLNFVSPNQYGGYAYIWTTGLAPETSNASIITAASDASGTSIAYTTKQTTNTFTGTTYNMYDAMTGKYGLSIVNGTSMTLTVDQSGDLIGYYVNASTANAYNAPTLNMWNSTQAILYPAGKPQGLAIWEWRPPQNCLVSFQNGIMWSKPLATNISGVALPATLGIGAGALGSGQIGGYDSGVLLMTAADPSSRQFQTGFLIEAGYSATTGEQLWITNRTQTPFTRIDTGPAGNGIYDEINIGTGMVTGYSITTGAKVWATQLTGANGGAPNAYDSSGGYYAQFANGVQYINGFGGDIWALNMTTGTIIWYTNTNEIQGPAGTATPYGVWPIWSFNNPGAIADGLLFLSEGHEYSPPLFHGAQQLALNLTNGQPVWTILSFNVNGGTAISDGIMTTLNAYDNQIYGYGKGPSAITVEAPKSSIELGKSLVISGTVHDISAGTKQNEQAARFPNGVPAVSDESQSAWMECVYMQQQCPTNATGVAVTISVIDANGNLRHIGSTTSDGSGAFSLKWTPDIEGKYSVIATFAGSQSYYGSSAETAFAVDIAPATPTPQPTQPASMADLYFVPGIIGVILAIIVVGAVIILALRKRP